MKNVAPKAMSIVMMEKKRVAMPTLNLLGSDTRKSSCAYLEVSMDKNINTDITEENNARASERAKTLKDVVCIKMGYPLLLLFPPGTVKIAANITVVISVATSMHDEAVFFSHFSPLAKPLCSSVNNIWGVLPSESLISLNRGCMIFSTSCKFKK